MEVLIYIIVGVAGVLAGALVTRMVLSGQASKAEQEAKARAEVVMKEAEVKAEAIRQQKKFDAQQHFQDLKQKLEAEQQERTQKLQANEQRVKQKEQTLNQKYENTKREQSKLEQQSQKVEEQSRLLHEKNEQLQNLLQEQNQKLEKIAGMSQDDALNKLMDNLMNEARSKASTMIKEAEENARLAANKEAKRIVIQTIQRTAAEHAIENSVTVFNLENDEVKGRIIL